MALQQIEYLIHGNILPLSIENIRISDRLLLERVYVDGYQDATWGKNVGHVKAYVGMEYEEKGAFFKRADEYLTLFLHLYTLETAQPHVLFRGVSIPVDDFSNLGLNKVSFPSFDSGKSLSEPFEHDVRFISYLKSNFERFASDYEEILSSPLGLSLQFIYDAVMANHRSRLELAVVHFIMAAEALVIHELNEISHRISKRIAVLVSDSPTELNEVYRKMKKLYGIRCGIVHGGGKRASPYDVQDLYVYLKKAVKECLIHDRVTKQDLIRKLDLTFDSQDFTSARLHLWST
jgi:hypothetical protein